MAVYVYIAFGNEAFNGLNVFGGRCQVTGRGLASEVMCVEGMAGLRV